MASLRSIGLVRSREEGRKLQVEMRDMNERAWEDLPTQTSPAGLKKKEHLRRY